MNTLINTLSITNDVTISDNIDYIPTSDIWIVDWYDNNLKRVLYRINSGENNFLKYKGKLLFLSLDDNCTTISIGIKNSIVHRLDGWITGMIWDFEYGLYDKSLIDKFILVPRYHIDNIDCIIPSKKENQMVFWGHTTGWLKLKGRNPRVECLKLIDDDYFLRSHFKGGLVVDYIIDSNESIEYRNSYKKFVVPVISNIQWQEYLSNSTLCLGLEGNTGFSYRHLESMRSKSTIISPPFLKDPGIWLFSDKLQDCVWFYKKDLSNFKSVCETALLNIDKTSRMAIEAFDIYKTYFEDAKYKTYNKLVSSIFYDKIEQLTGIKLI